MRQALALSKHVAAGLLDRIVRELTRREVESKEGLIVLEAAAKEIRTDREAAREAEQAQYNRMVAPPGRR